VKPFNLGCKVKRAEVVLENVGDMPPNFFKKPKCGYESETMEKKKKSKHVPSFVTLQG